MKQSLIAFAGFITLFITACSDPAFYEKNQAITKRSWTYAETANFDVTITDKNAKYDLLVNVRHTGEYNYSNLFLLLHQSGKLLKDTARRYEIKLAELDGRWTGNTAGSLYENQLIIKENYTFPDTGVYHFRIEQNMRENPLKDISDVGIKLIKKP